MVILCGFNVGWIEIWSRKENWHIYDKTAKELGYKIKKMKSREDNWVKILD